MSHPYCTYVAAITDESDVDKIYHDNHYGVRIDSDNELFCRLVMEINQAGLSWHTILVKEKHFRKAYSNFDITKVARYGEEDFGRLMSDAGIIRNRLKIHAAIHNAKQLLAIQKEFGSFRNWLDVQKKEIELGIFVIPAKAGIQCLESMNTNLDSRLRGNDNTETKNEIKKLWLKLFKKNFKFVGGEIVGEFLMSIDMLPGSHDKNCEVSKQ
ncbi:MAG: DNA-3-methyladenine glycosylase I [Candidatus Paceibacterota bacterium]